MEYNLKFANGRKTSVHTTETGTPLQDIINDAEKRFSSHVTTINGKPVKEHALGGFIIGALLGAGAVGLTKRNPGTKKVYIKVPSGSKKPKEKSNKPKVASFSKYLSKREIDMVKSSEGKEYSGSDILDGVHIKKDKFAGGGSSGHVSKGAMVWKKLTPAKRLEFLVENFTPAITPRTQQTLSGKSFNFLPSSVKMVVESHYANVEEYKGGGYTGTDERIKKMVEHWNKYGWASGSFDGDDSEFFEAIGKTSMSTPITSQTGSDIKYYDDKRVDSALRHIKFAPGGVSDGLGIEWAKRQIKDRALFVGYFYWGGYNESSIWQSFDEVYSLSSKFVNSYDPDKTWEDDSFEEYMESFIKKNMPKK